MYHHPSFTEARIDLDQLAANYHASRGFIGEHLRYMAVVKANAYGHGAVECARRLEAEGIDWFGVALVREGFELRSAGITKPILILGSLRSGEEEALVSNALTPVIFDLQTATSLSDHLGGNPYDVHVKIDTGMGRLGVRFDQAADFAAQIKLLSDLRVAGMMTHFAAADDPAQDEFTTLQIQRFNAAVEAFRSVGFEPEICGVANSPGAIGHPAARVDLVRLGGALYGLLDDILPHDRPAPGFRPVMTLVSHIALVKDVLPGESVGYGRTFIAKRRSRIALIPVGYADGYRRALSNQAHVIIRDTSAPVIGRISMDWTIVDITDVQDAAAGDEVLLIGSSASHSVTAADVARECGTIGYEITCGIGPRVPRVYAGAG